jgi:hypothetical protein
MGLLIKICFSNFHELGKNIFGINFCDIILLNLNNMSERGSPQRDISFILSAIYPDVDAYSLQVPKIRHPDAKRKALVYGEIDPPTFSSLLEIVARPGDSVFYDLGSGVGRLVYAAAFSNFFKQSIGIEIVSSRHDLAVSARNNFHEFSPNTEVTFINDSFLSIDFSNADVVFLAGTAIPKDVMKKLIVKFRDLKHGARIIITDKEIADKNNFELELTSDLRTDFDISEAHIYRRK